MYIIIISLLVVCFFFFYVPLSFFIIFGALLLVYSIFGFVVAILGRKKTVNVLYKKITTIKFIKKAFSKLTESVGGKIDLEKIKSPWRHLLEHKKEVAKATAYQLCIFIADTLTI